MMEGFVNPNEMVGVMRQRIAEDAVVIARLHETVDALRRRLLETQLVATATVCSMQLEIEQLKIDALDDALAEAGMGSSGERAVAVTPLDIWNLDQLNKADGPSKSEMSPTKGSVR